MFEWIIKKIIKDYKNVEDSAVREKYGVICSIISIVLNTLMAFFKIIIGYISGSIAITADGYNNFSDIGSNLATLFGFKLAGKHPDGEHPYGHGRVEYIVGMVISFLILMVGFTSFKESIIKIFNPEEVIFSYYAIIVLVISILIKFWMSYFNSQAGQKINSSSLLAAAQDSVNDVYSTLATLISLILSRFIDIPIDGFMGLIVSVLVIRSGIEIFKEMMTSLLGKAPDPELVKEIEAFVMEYDEVLGMHDLMIHDYGPGRKYMTFHAEVDRYRDISDIHDQIDEIERAILQKFKILTTIHMDPIDIKDEYTNKLKEKVITIVKNINKDYTIHDFRVVRGKSHTNLIFDVVLPPDDTTKHSDVKNKICQEINKIGDEKLYCVIEVEHSYC